jgi:hypothetical protein
MDAGHSTPPYLHRMTFLTWATGTAVQYVALIISHQPGLEERFAHIPILDTRPASKMTGLVWSCPLEIDLTRLMDS